MIDPWTTLELSPDADEKTIRRRYLELVRQYPPDRDAQRFQEIRSAYDALRAPAERLRRQIFSLEADRSIEDVLKEVQSRVKKKRIPTSLLLSLGRE